MFTSIGSPFSRVICTVTIEFSSVCAEFAPEEAVLEGIWGFDVDKLQVDHL